MLYYVEKSEKMKKLKVDWLKENCTKLIIAIIITVLFFVLSVILKKIVFDIIAIVIGFASFFYFHNNYKAYMEKNIYPKNK